MTMVSHSLGSLDIWTSLHERVSYHFYLHLFHGYLCDGYLWWLGVEDVTQAQCTFNIHSSSAMVAMIGLVPG